MSFETNFWGFVTYLAQNGFVRIDVPEGQASKAILKKGDFQIEFSTGCWWLDKPGNKLGISTVEELKKQYYAETGKTLILK